MLRLCRVRLACCIHAYQGQLGRDDVAVVGVELRRPRSQRSSVPAVVETHMLHRLPVLCSVQVGGVTGNLLNRFWNQEKEQRELDRKPVQARGSLPLTRVGLGPCKHSMYLWLFQDYVEIKDSESQNPCSNLPLFASEIDSASRDCS